MQARWFEGSSGQTSGAAGIEDGTERRKGMAGKREIREEDDRVDRRME